MKDGVISQGQTTINKKGRLGQMDFSTFIHYHLVI